MGKITGRSDDMLIVRGVNVFPSQIEEQILRDTRLSGNYQVHLARDGHLDTVEVRCELQRELSGGLTPEAVADMRDAGAIVELDGKLLVPLSDGTVNDKKCDRISDTRNHYVLLLDTATGGWKEAPAGAAPLIAS
jgi:phenylacetate-coenzyme A ligase PaaK-like adenylate-forming protein